MFKGFQAGGRDFSSGGASNSNEAALEADWALKPLVIARLLLIELLLRKLFGAEAVIAVIVSLAITGAITVTGEASPQRRSIVSAVCTRICHVGMTGLPGMAAASANAVAPLVNGRAAVVQQVGRHRNGSLSCAREFQSEAHAEAA